MSKTEISKPYTTHFPRADIHELITPDLLHQVIKGVFKDHLVDWVSKYLEHRHGGAGSERVLDEIDQRLVPHLLLMPHTHHMIELHLHPHSQVYVGSSRGGTLINGLGMTLSISKMAKNLSQLIYFSELILTYSRFSPG